MNYNEFKERVKMGEEFQFYYLDESYWISNNKNGFYLTREKDSFIQSYATAENLFDQAKINGFKIIEIWRDIDL